MSVVESYCQIFTSIWNIFLITKTIVFLYFFTMEFFQKYLKLIKQYNKVHDRGFPQYCNDQFLNY